MRRYLLADDEREEMTAYIKNPSVMTSRLRQARLAAWAMDFKQLRKDLELIQKFGELKIPKGRVAKALRSGFRVGPKKREKTDKVPKPLIRIGKIQKKEGENGNRIKK